MRSLRIATCTSGDPVSVPCVRYEPMTSVFLSFVSATSASTYGPERGVPPLHAAVYLRVRPQDDRSF